MTTTPQEDPRSDATPPDPKPIYDLSPVDQAPGKPAPAASPEPRQSKVGDAGLLDDFDEDADFDRDPALQRALNADKPAPRPPESPPFVKPGWGDPQPLALIATGVLLAAVIAAGVTGSGRWYASAVSAAYSTLLQALTGVGAVAAAAYLSEMRLGSLPLAAARMFLAVSVFVLIFHLNIPIQGRVDEVVLASAAYVGVVWALFRVGGEKLFFIAAIHAVLWFIIYLSALLHTWATTATPITPAT